MNDPFCCDSCGATIHNKTYWCINRCDHQRFIEGWTTGNAEYDAIVKGQNVRSYGQDYLRWIRWDRLQNLVEIKKAEFGVVYKADWLDGQFGGVHFEQNGKRV